MPRIRRLIIVNLPRPAKRRGERIVPRASRLADGQALAVTHRLGGEPPGHRGASLTPCIAAISLLRSARLAPAMANDLPATIVTPGKRWVGRLLGAGIFAVAAALAPSAAQAESDYPAGLFENSPVVPGGPPGSPGPPGGPDDRDPEQPEASAPLDDFCATIAGRTFHSLAEVRRAHARCDPGRDAGPVPPDDGLGR
jgi:hypothetical protein